MPLIVKIRCNVNDDKSGHEVQLLLTWPTLNDLLCCIASCPSFAQCHVIQQSECRTAGSTDFFNFVFNQEHFSWTVHPLQCRCWTARGGISTNQYYSTAEEEATTTLFCIIILNWLYSSVGCNYNKSVDYKKKIVISSSKEVIAKEMHLLAWNKTSEERSSFWVKSLSFEINH